MARALRSLAATTVPPLLSHASISAPGSASLRVPIPALYAARLSRCYCAAFRQIGQSGAFTLAIMVRVFLTGAAVALILLPVAIRARSYAAILGVAGLQGLPSARQSVSTPIPPRARSRSIMKPFPASWMP